MDIFSQDILVALAANLALLALALITYNQISAFLGKLPSRFERWFAGLAFGLAAILSMSVPITVAPGVLVDGRAVPIGLAALSGGPFVAGVAAVLAALFRLALGGVGALAGVIWIVLAALSGILVAKLSRRGGTGLAYAHLLLLGVLLVFSQLIATFFLPGSELAYTVITASTPPAAVALPLGTLFLGTLLVQERRRRDAEAAVIESERRFHTITDNLPGVVYQRLLTVSGEISYPFFSARVLELFGVTAEEAVADASKILNTVHVDDFDRFTASIKESARQLSVWDHEYRVVRKDGAFRWMHAKAVPHRRENGDVMWDGIVTDDTERKIAEMSLGVANQLLTSTNQRLSTMYETAHDFVDNVAHEFRTPLTVIKEFAAIMEEGLVGALNAEQSDYLRVICARVDDLNGLVNDMLDLSRLEAGLIGVSRRECTIEDIVGRVESILQRRAKASNVDFAVEIEAGLPALFCDPEKIGRVLINLGVNAFKYGGDKGGVRLWARYSANPREIVIGVSDRGPGIPAEKLEMIFERFRQAGGLRDTAKGFGLGLSIVRELADLNLGEIAVQSTVGEGTTFSLTLPIFDPPAIVGRYVAKLARERTSSFYVSDIRIALSGAVDTVAADDCEAFLQQQVKREDLLMRLGRDSWILLTADKRDTDMRAKADRLRDGLAAHAAEIGGGAMAVEVQPVGVWRLPHQSEALIARFRALRDMAQARRSA
jgi:PAS domain S-box-containing protein